MLAKMYLTNFLSFKERTEIDLTASKYSILGKQTYIKAKFLKAHCLSDQMLLENQMH